MSESFKVRFIGDWSGLESNAREMAFIESRRLVARQIEQAFRIPSYMWGFDIYRLAAFTQQGRIESSIRLKVVGA